MNEDLCNNCESACEACEAQQADNARLRAWLRRWRDDPHAHPPGIGSGTVVPNAELHAAIAGSAPPRKARKAGKC